MLGSQTLEAGVGLPDHDVAQLSYDAVEDRGRRRPPKSTIKTEDGHATERRRRILSATTQDLARNYELAAWTIRKHLDYVSMFSFQGKTDDRGFNTELEQFVERISAREIFDAARRHHRGRFVRLAEAVRCLDGDCGALKLTTRPYRGSVQAVEGNRIALGRGDLPKDDDPKQWIRGVKVGDAGSAMAYAISDRDRTGSRLTLRRIVAAQSLIFHAFYQRFDQVRGVSPLAAALNRFRDTYEGFEYALAKTKLAQLFGIAVKRDADESLFGKESTSATADNDGDGTNESGYEFNLSGGGPFVVDVDPEDSIDFIESKTPSTETVNFLKLAIHIAIKSLDIPFSFFDESFTNFYGSRGGLIQYLRSCKTKIEDLQEFQNAWMRWRLGIAVADGELELPSGKSFDWLRWQFVPIGVPWWDPVKEARGAGMSIAMGLSNPYREAQMLGSDFEENLRRIAEAQNLAKELGVDLKYADTTAFNPEITVEGGGDAN